MSKLFPELRCSKCGASTQATCHCDVAYITKLEYAARYVEKYPEKSDRVIAKEVNVSKDTVARARKQLAQNAPVAKRKGKDGKFRNLPKKRDIPPAARNQQFTPQEEWEGSLTQLATFIITMDKVWTGKFGNWKQFNMTPCTYELITRAERIWSELVSSVNPAKPNVKPNGKEKFYVVSNS
jgi:hypothetical protein